jgi:hypothetical protein
MDGLVAKGEEEAVVRGIVVLGSVRNSIWVNRNGDVLRIQFFSIVSWILDACGRKKCIVALLESPEGDNNIDPTEALRGVMPGSCIIPDTEREASVARVSGFDALVEISSDITPGRADNMYFVWRDIDELIWSIRRFEIVKDGGDAKSAGGITSVGLGR